MSVNKVILIGRLGQNPEVRHTPSGSSVANFSVATNESWTDKSGQKQERTEWHSVVLFNKLAEIAQQYVKKGSKVYIEGQLQTRKWQDKDGQDRYSTEVVLQGFNGTLTMLDGRAGGAGAGAVAGDDLGHPGLGDGEVGDDQLVDIEVVVVLGVGDRRLQALLDVFRDPLL